MGSRSGPDLDTGYAWVIVLASFALHFQQVRVVHILTFLAKVSELLPEQVFERMQPTCTLCGIVSCVTTSDVTLSPLPSTEPEILTVSHPKKSRSNQVQEVNSFQGHVGWSRDAS